MFYVKQDHLFPVFEKGVSSVFVAGAMIFVAFEGFQLITNAVMETEDPERNIPRGIYGSIIITSLIYFSVALVAVGNLTPAELTAAEEYALAVAAQPALGNAGQVLVGLAALLATSSAVNATAFGASRMMAEMATSNRLPQAFSFRSRTDVPWLSVVVLTGLALGFTVLGGLETIATFSSMTFLLVSITVSVANYRLRSITKSRIEIVLLGIGLMLATVVLLLGHLWSHERPTLYWLVGFFLAIAVVEMFFCHRECPLSRTIQTVNLNRATTNVSLTNDGLRSPCPDYHVGYYRSEWFGVFYGGWSSPGASATDQLSVWSRACEVHPPRLGCPGRISAVCLLAICD